MSVEHSVVKVTMAVWLLVLAYAVPRAVLLTWGRGRATMIDPV